MRHFFLAFMLAGCATTQALEPAITYDGVATICTEIKTGLVKRAETPPTAPETAAYEATRRTCQAILDEIERKANAQE